MVFFNYLVVNYKAVEINKNHFNMILVKHGTTTQSVSYEFNHTSKETFLELLP